MGYLATGEIFENMLQLKRFGPEHNFKMVDAIWCIFDALF